MVDALVVQQCNTPNNLIATDGVWSTINAPLGAKDMSHMLDRMCKVFEDQTAAFDTSIRRLGKKIEDMETVLTDQSQNKKPRGKKLVGSNITCWGCLYHTIIAGLITGSALLVFIVLIAFFSPN